MKLPDGGPAFPRPIGNNGATHYEDRDVSVEQEGMTLADYFAAHAPRKMASWYQPTMPPRPARRYDHDHPNAAVCELASINGDVCCIVNAAELDAYDAERRRQTDLQWPYAYADAMLAVREKRDEARREQQAAVIRAFADEDEA